MAYVNITIVPITTKAHDILQCKNSRTIFQFIFQRYILDNIRFFISRMSYLQNLKFNKKKMWRRTHQYPPNLYDPIIKDTLNNILQEPECQQTEDQSTQTIRKFPLVLQYRGKCTEEYARALHHCSAPCSIIMTLKKLKTTMPSLKPPVEKMIRSGVIYQISCPRCTACYVGQTSRHLQTPVREHTKNQGPVKTHLHQCNAPSLRNISTSSHPHQEGRATYWL